MHAIDLTPLANVGIELLATVLMGVGTVAVGYLVRLLHLSNKATAAAIESKANDVLQRAATNAAAYGMSQVDALDKGGKMTVSTKNQAIGIAVDYVNTLVPDTVTKLKASEPAISKLVEAKLGQLVLGSTPAPAAAPAPAAPPAAKP